MKEITAAITAVAGWVPEDTLTNQDLEKMVNTSDEWIISRTGIKERRILKGEGRGTSFMGIKAVELLLEKSATDPASIDVLICATATPDMGFASTANIISAGIGAINAFGFDLAAACSGFLYALEAAANFIRSGRYNKILVVGADKMSAVMDYADRANCIIFGDGAAAVLVEPNHEGNGVMDAVLKSDGQGSSFLHIKGGGSAYPASHATVDQKQHYFYQDGKSVFKHAVTKMTAAALEIMERNKLTYENIAYLVPHQANMRIIEAVSERIGMAMEKVTTNIEKYGNTTGATIPLCLWEWEKKFKKGDNLLLAAFGGGFTWGALYLKWAY